MRAYTSYILPVALVIGNVLVSAPARAQQQQQSPSQQTPRVEFTIPTGEHVDAFIPPGWEEVRVSRCKPFPARITLRLYRLRLLQGYNLPPASSGGGYMGEELDTSAQPMRRRASKGRPARNEQNAPPPQPAPPGGETGRPAPPPQPKSESEAKTTLRTRLAAQYRSILETLHRREENDPRVALVLADTRWNWRYAWAIFNRAPHSLMPQLFQGVSPNVEIVDPNESTSPNARRYPVTDENLEALGLWRFDVHHVTNQSLHIDTDLVEVSVSWTLQVMIDPRPGSASAFLNARFSAPPSEPPSGQDHPKEIEKNALAAVNPQQNAGNAVEKAQEKEENTQAAPTDQQKQEAQSPQAVSVLEQAFGLQGLIPGLFNQPGIDVVAGLAVPDNGPQGVAGAVLFEDRRDPCEDNTPAPLSMRTLWRNLGLLAGHTIGKGGAYVIAPSLKVGSSSWIFFGGAFGDSNGSTRQGLVGGVTFRISNLLGGGGGGGGGNTPSPPQFAQVAVNVAESEQDIRKGPESFAMNHAVLSLEWPDKSTGRIDLAFEGKPPSSIEIFGYSGRHNLLIQTGTLTQIGIERSPAQGVPPQPLASRSTTAFAGQMSLSLDGKNINQLPASGLSVNPQSVLSIAVPAPQTLQQQQQKQPPEKQQPQKPLK